MGAQAFNQEILKRNFRIHKRLEAVKFCVEFKVVAVKLSSDKIEIFFFCGAALHCGIALHLVVQSNHFNNILSIFILGVNPQSCPNYPYCDVNVGLAQHGHNGHAARAAPLQGFTERLYPAGVNPASCPNYPEC